MTLAQPQRSTDIEFASDFLALNSLLEACNNGEKVALLLSTCRNAYLTVNAIFVDLQILLGGEGQSLRGAAELLIRGETKRVGELLGRASQTFSVLQTKREVWESREDLHLQMETSLSSMADPLAADRIKLMLDGVRSPSGDMLGGWDNETLALDMSHRAHLEDSFVALDRVVEILGCCIAIGRMVATNSIGQRQGSLELFEQPERADGQHLLVGDAAFKLAQCCGWNVIEEGDDVVVDPLNARSRGAKFEEEIVRIPRRMTVENVEDARIGVGLIIRDAMYLCHDRLRTGFKANVAQRPMPDPFVIELAAETRSLPQGRVREIKPSRVRCRTSNSPRDHVRIAIANLALPETELDEYQIKAELKAQVTQDVRMALKVASNQNCQAVIFPEYSIPKSLSKELLDSANNLGLLIVGGLEGEWKGDKLADQAIVAIPGETKLHYQFKQEPSLYEETGKAFYSDNTVSIFTGSPIGDFAVTVCSDWLETTTMRVWRADQHMPEIHIVVARNDYTDLYHSFAIGDSMRLYAAVVIANVSKKDGQWSNEGSCVVVPRGKNPELEATHVDVGGTFCKSLSVHDLDMRAIRARSRGKPEPGYFPVPKSAQRT